MAAEDLSSLSCNSSQAHRHLLKHGTSSVGISSACCQPCLTSSSVESCWPLQKPAVNQCDTLCIMNLQRSRKAFITNKITSKQDNVT